MFEPYNPYNPYYNYGLQPQQVTQQITQQIPKQMQQTYKSQNLIGLQGKVVDVGTHLEIQ